MLAASVSCGGTGNVAQTSAVVPSVRLRTAATTTPIQHVVILIQENRSFDDLFATFPHADGATKGLMSNGHWQPLVKGPLLTYDMEHNHATFLTEYDGGKMDGFNLAYGVIAGKVQQGGTYPYRYVDPNQIKPYWTLAKRYVLADHMFATQSSGSFTAHQDLIAGGTQVKRDARVIDFPSLAPYGCDAPAGTVTSLIYSTGKVARGGGPFPCFSYATLRDLLDGKGVSWRYYVQPDTPGGGGEIWDAFDAISKVRHGPEWSTNVSWPETNVLTDAANGTLPAVSWVIPSTHNSDHPGQGPDLGPSWIAQVVNAIGRTPAWKSTAIIILWDDWGGLYDHFPPPQLTYDGLGMRVPMIVVSPYARRGYVSHTQYEFGSILRFVEDNWNLGSLGSSDARANSIGDVFDFAKPARAFETVPADKSLEFFEHEPISTEPVDEE